MGDEGSSCEDVPELCSDELLTPVRSTVTAFYNGLANACDDVSDCVTEYSGVSRDGRECVPGCFIGVSRTDALALRAFVGTDANLASQCETISDEQCLVNISSCPASAPDCVDHKCTTVLRDPAVACSSTQIEPIRNMVDDHYFSLRNHCDEDSDCTRVTSAITRNDQTCWNGCSFAVSVSEASAFADFLASDTMLTTACESVIDAGCKVYAQSCAYDEIACVAHECTLL